jgi:hypothetical protein
MELTIKGTPEEIADALRKLGAEPREIATPTPQPVYVPAPFYVQPGTAKDPEPWRVEITCDDTTRAPRAVQWTPTAIWEVRPESYTWCSAGVTNA